MKKTLLLSLAFIALCFTSKSQVSAYTFSQNSGAYTAISGGSLIATATASTGVGTLDNVIYNLPTGTFPFTFDFNGVGYTGCNISTNGFITFGGMAPAASNYNPISSTETYSGSISAWGADLNTMFSIGSGSVTGSIRVETVGISPNREVVIQYSNWRPSYIISTINVYALNFQIRLQETNNIISIVYGPNGFIVGSTALSGTRQIGLRGGANIAFNNRLNGVALTFTNSTAGTLNSSTQAFNTNVVTPGTPFNGLTYVWTPPVACSGTPTAGISVASATTICAPSNVNLSLSGVTAASGLTYQWLSSPDNLNWVTLPTATLSTRTQSVLATEFYACEVACGINTATSTGVQISIAPTTTNTIPYFEGFEGVPTAGILPNCSWLRTGDWTTNIGPQSSSRIAKTGTKYAHTSWSTIPGGDMMYTNGLDLTAGTSYYASVDYNTDGVAGFTELSMLISPNQSTVGAVNIASAFSVANTAYTNLANTFSVAISGIYYLGFRVIAPTSVPNFLMIDDISVILAPTCTLTPVAGVITGTNTTNVGNVDTYSVTGSAGNIQWFRGSTASGPWTLISGATSATQTITAVSSGTVFYTVITSGIACTSATATAISVINNFPGDNVCDAIPLPLGVTTTTYSLFGATAQAGEVYFPLEFNNVPPSNSVWFSFVAPASGYVSVQAPDFDSQLAVWSTTNCANLVGQATPTAPIGATLIGANDDDAAHTANGGVIFSSYVLAPCLTPGVTYYIQLDPFAAAASAASRSRVLVRDMVTLVTATTSNTLVCLGASRTLSATTSATSFTWSTGATTRSISVTPTVTTVYTVSVTINGCAGTSTIQLNVTVPTVTATASSASVCAGSPVILTANSTATTYTWSSGANTMTTSVNPTVFTVYTTTVTDVNLCRATSTVAVGIYTNPTVTATASSASVCAGSPVTLTANTAETTYAWSSGANTMTTSVNPTIFTVYTTTVTDINLCRGTSTVSVGIYANPTVTATAFSASVCVGSPVTLTANSTATTYAWSSGANTMTTSVNPNVFSVYSTTVTDINSCRGTSTVSVGIFATPTITVNSGAICSGGTFTFNPIGVNTFTISGGASVVSPASTETYSVTGTSLDGCIAAQVTATVDVVSSLTVSISGPTSICAGKTLTLTGSGASTYSWSTGAVSISIIDSPAGITTYSVIGTSGTCSNTAVVSVTVNAIPTLTVNSGAICSGESFTINASGANTYTYSSGSNIVSPTALSSYTVLGTDLLGCIGNAISSVSVNAVPTLTVNSGAICSGKSFTINASGANTYTYSSGVNIVSPTALASYTITGENLLGCFGNAVSTVSVNAAPTLTVNSGAICSGKSFTINASGANTFTYSSGSNIVTPTALESYTVTGSDLIGCEGIAISSVSVNAVPTLTVNSGVICSGRSFTINASGANTYTYSSGSNVVSPLALASYTVTGSNTFGCVGSSVSSVSVNASPVVNVISSKTLVCSNLNESAILTASTSATSYTWNTGAITVSISVTPTLTTTYTVNVTGSNGCITRGNVTVNASICNSIEELAANSISIYPNPTNGILSISLTSNLSQNSTLEIYDALGKLVVREKLLNELNTFNVSNLENGLYMFRITSNNNVVKIGKLIKD